VAAALVLAMVALGVETARPVGLVTRLSADTRDPIRRVVETRQGIVVAYADDKLGDVIFGGNVYDGRTNVDPRVNSNQINRILVYRIRHSDGRTLVEPTALRAQRDYNYDDDLALAKQREADLLYEDMERDLLQQLVRRLAAVQT